MSACFSSRDTIQNIDNIQNIRTKQTTNSNDFSKILQGEIYVQNHFLTGHQVELLRKDILQLQRHKLKRQAFETTGFQPSGLSNRVPGDRNEFGKSDRLTCTITPDLFRGNTTLSNMRRVVEEKLQSLKFQLETALSKSQGLELAEMYYSLSPEGSHLPRHQDERHEETKGEKGYIHETRRSISWLIYLNENGWEATKDKEDENYEKKRLQAFAGCGGELRAYLRKCCTKQGVQCGSHDGNIQVGWLRVDDDDCNCDCNNENDHECEYEPVFLDSWVKTRTTLSKQNEDEGFQDCTCTPQWQAMSALYRFRSVTETEIETDPNNKQKQKQIQPEEQNFHQHSDRDYLSQPFGPNSPSWPLDSNLEPVDFASALALQLSRADHQRRFVGVEDIRASTIVDVVPTGGTLVMFDSATVPHEVLQVQKGTRMAIAGWYHEPQQEFPEWYGE